jgi:hypothetical protein
MDCALQLLFILHGEYGKKTGAIGFGKVDSKQNI